MSTQTTSQEWYQCITDDDRSHRLVLTGDYTMTALENKFDNLLAELAQYAENQDLCWDLSRIHSIDTTGTIMLWRAWKAQRPNHPTSRT